jgi:two-component system NtrC family sensor kinase
MDQGHPDYRALFRGTVRRMVVVSLLPLLGMGIAGLFTFYKLNRSIVLQQHAASLRYHRESIAGFLGNISTALDTVAHQYSLEELRRGDLERVFKVMQQQDGIFTDVGIIDSAGNHVKYLGPYDLAGKNYRHTVWFEQVVSRGVYVSDMFMGFRRVPHFIVAVKRQAQDRFWILRATVSTDYFSKLVDAVRMGRTGETFIVNREGLNQSRTRFGGELLAPSGFPDLAPHENMRSGDLSWNGRHYLYTSVWLSNPRWLLISRQEVWDALTPLRRAAAWVLASLLVGALAATVLAVVVARGQVRLVMKADAQKQALTQKLLVAGRTAAVGEMSAGLAHEINNPLATVDVLRTWISDLVGQATLGAEDRQEILDAAAKIGAQVERCKAITQGLLKFSRRAESAPQMVDLDTLLQELATVSRARARLDSIEIETDLGGAPPVWGTPAHMQQVFVNLVNNALDAAAGRPNALVTIRSRAVDDGVRVEVVDNGPGITPEDLPRIFSPFFTTKPVGKGTGLGLAITYGLVQELGGTIGVHTRPGETTTFAVTLPVRQPAGLGPGEARTT